MAQVTLRERIDVGEFHAKLPWLGGKNNAAVQARKEFRDEQRRLEGMFHDEALVEVGLTEELYSNDVREMAFAMAWESGHAAGYLQVLQTLEELADLVKLVAIGVGVGA